MLSPEELQTLLVDLESDRIERTASTTNTDKFAEAVCAFANDLPNHRQPGYLVVGVDDAGQPSGLVVTDQLLQNLAALRSQGNILPLPAITVAKLALPGGEVAVVEVQPSDLPPVRYKGQVRIRVGPSRGIASEQEERILSERRSWLASTFDASLVREASRDELALGLFSSYRQLLVDAQVIALNRRSIEEQLASLRFFEVAKACATVAGILVFGKNPRYWLPGAYVQWLRFPGRESVETPTDQAEIDGDLQSVVRECEGRARAHNQTGMVRVSAFQEKLVPDYPELAIQQILLNAFMHRDYRSTTPIRFYWFADRIEIQSSGGLVGEVTVATLGRRSAYRNPVIAEAMKALGYVNRFGLGIQMAQTAMAQNGNPPIEFEADDRVFAAVLRRRPT